MSARSGQVDVTHAVAPDFGLGDFNTALLANHTAVLQALVFTAQTFVVLDGAKNLCTKQAIALRLEGPVVDGLGLFDFAKRPGTDFLRRGNSDFDGIKMLIWGELFEQVEERFHSFKSFATSCLTLRTLELDIDTE